MRRAGRQLGIDKKTILRWARDDDLDPRQVALRVSEQNRVASAASFARVQLDRAEARERVIMRLLRLSELSLARELEVLVAGNFTRDDLQALTNARMKAIQQFELLEGRVTVRQDLGMDSILVGVSAAIQVGLEVLPEAMAQLARDAIAVGLREVQAQGMSAMPAISEHVEDGEFEDAARTS